MSARSSRKGGRYDSVNDATDPGPDLPRVKLAGRVETVTAAVADPNPVEGEKLKRQRVSVNRLTDPLECERSAGRISEPAYLAGRAYQRICERAAIGVAGGGLEPTHGAGNRDLAMAKRIGAAQSVVDMQGRLIPVIGAWAAFIVRAVLQDGHSFKAVAVMAGVRKRRKKQIVARAFREAIEDIARHWERHGWPN